MSFFISLPFTDNPDNPDNYYESSVSITNTFSIINLTYQNILRSIPLPKTLLEVRDKVLDPTLYQTNTQLLTETQYKFPVYTYVWKLDLENSNLSTVSYHPRFPLGTTAEQADVIIGSNLATTALKTYVDQVKIKPYGYQTFFTKFYWPVFPIFKYNFFLTYMPSPNSPYNNDELSSNYNPIYMIGSGIL